MSFTRNIAKRALDFLERLTKRFINLSAPKKTLIILIPIIYVILLIVLRQSIGAELLEATKDKETFHNFLNSFGLNGEIAFVAIRAIQTVIKIVPAEPLEIGAGYIWGTYKGMALCMLGTEIGSFVILFLTSVFGTRILNLLFDVNKINEWSFVCNSKKKYLLLTIIYLIPGTPKDFITYFVGITDTRILPFLIITGIARIPSIITSTWCGCLLDTKSIWSFVIAFSAITIVSSVLGYYSLKTIQNIKQAHH